MLIFTMYYTFIVSCVQHNWLKLVYCNQVNIQTIVCFVDQPGKSFDHYVFLLIYLSLIDKFMSIC